MDRIEIVAEEGEVIPQEVLDFVEELNYLKDEGFFEAEQGEDGVVRLYPTED